MNKKSPLSLLYGIHAVTAALNNKKRHIVDINITREQHEKMNNIPKEIPVHIVDKKMLDKMLPPSTPHQNIIARCKPLEGSDISDLPIDGNSVVLILDQVTDPHNVGSIIRSAVAFNADAIILPKDNAATENGAMAKAASGGLDIINLIYVTNISRTLQTLKDMNYFCVGLSGHTSTELHQLNLTGRIAFILGAEGKGMRRLVQESCDTLAKVPIHVNMESLNVSNCATITLYEYRKQNNLSS